MEIQLFRIDMIQITVVLFERLRTCLSNQRRPNCLNGISTRKQVLARVDVKDSMNVNSVNDLELTSSKNCK